MSYNVYATIRNNLDVELQPSGDKTIVSGTLAYPLHPVPAGGQGAFQIKADISDEKGSSGHVKYVAEIGHTSAKIQFHFHVSSALVASASITSSDDPLITAETTGISSTDHPLRPVYIVGRAPGTRSAT